jgi:hypothetical protein
MSSSTALALFQATLFFHAKPGVPARLFALIVRAASFGEAERLANRIGGADISGILIETAPADLPGQLELRTRNGVTYMVMAR